MMPAVANPLAVESVSPYITAGISFVLTLAVSVASYQLFKKPILRLKTVDWRNGYPAMKLRLSLLTRP